MLENFHRKTSTKKPHGHGTQKTETLPVQLLRLQGGESGFAENAHSQPHRWKTVFLRPVPVHLDRSQLVATSQVTSHRPEALQMFLLSVRVYTKQHLQGKWSERVWTCWLKQFLLKQAHLKTKHPGMEKGLMFTCFMCPYRTVNKDMYGTHLVTVHKQKPPSTSWVLLIIKKNQKFVFVSLMLASFELREIWQLCDVCQMSFLCQTILSRQPCLCFVWGKYPSLEQQFVKWILNR